MFEAVEQFVIDSVQAWGYPGIVLFILLETVLPVIPSELILPLAGFLAGRGHLWLPGAIVAATVGSVSGASIIYGAGRWYGDDRLRRHVRCWGRYLLLREDDLDRAHGWFERHGTAAVLVGRLVPGVRSLISLPAGVTRMSPSVFLLYTTLGSVAWNTLLIGLGWWLGSRWRQVDGYVSYLQYAVALLALAAIAWLVWRRRDTWQDRERER